MLSQALLRLFLSTVGADEVQVAFHGNLRSDGAQIKAR